jgi:excisionase family DNA binding protein
MTYLTVREAAQRAGVSGAYVRAEIAAGRLAAIRPEGGTYWIINEREFERWLANPRRGTRSGK